MGIPFFFKTIVSAYPDIYTKCINHKIVKCDRLFLDFNCILHQSANTIMENINKEKKVLKTEDIEDLIIEDSLIYTISIIRKCTPTSLLYIGVDGLCPMAKIVQQRCRRYVSVWKNEKMGDDKECWDRNNITPGTRFMAKFNVCISEFAKNIKLGFKVLVSDSSEFGEGEHKIMDYININDNNNEQVFKDIIYGLDADLILLGLLNKNNDNIMLLRDDSYLNISELKKSIIFHYFNCNNNNININNLFIRDFVILCSLLGNDFLPSLTYMKIKNNGIDRLMRFYMMVREELSANLTMSDGINFLFLTRIIEHVSQCEDLEMSEAIIAHKKRRVNFIKNALDSINNYPMLNKEYYNMDTNWRKNYYYSLFQKNHSFSFIQTVCANYIDGMNFIFNYYCTTSKKNVDYFWNYEHLYSPTAVDLYAFLNLSNLYDDKNINNYEKFKKSITPTVQLMLVLPPSSLKILLPKHFENIVCNYESGCMQYYPTSFKISKFLKTYIWECYPILPKICVENVINKINQS